MASLELALEPKPLSESVQNVPSSIVLIPEKPWIGWPSSGSLMSVTRWPSLPGTVPSVSVRLRSGVVNLPECLRNSGASAGAGTSVLAGRIAWPASLAGKACSPAEGEAAMRKKRETEVKSEAFMETSRK